MQREAVVITVTAPDRGTAIDLASTLGRAAMTEKIGLMVRALSENTSRPGSVRYAQVAIHRDELRLYSQAGGHDDDA